MKDWYIDDIIWLFEWETVERINKWIDKINTNRRDVLANSNSVYLVVKWMETRKEQAMYIKEYAISPWTIFAMIDWKDIEEWLWKCVVPSKLFFTSLNVPNEKKE